MSEHPDRRPDVVVVGGGVIGCADALELARMGYRVLVLDRGPAAGAGSTSSSSAVIRFHYSTLDGVVAAWEAMHMWQRWPEHLGVADEAGLARFHRIGVLVLDPDAEHVRQVLGLFDQVGVPYERWDAATARRQQPLVDPGRYGPPKRVDDPAFWGDPDGALDVYYTPDGGFVDDPQLAAHNLMVAAQARAVGATFRFGAEVVEIRTAGGRVAGVRLATGEVVDAPVVVNAAGPHSSQMNRLAGVLDDFVVGTRPLRQEVHALDAPPGFRVGGGGTVVTDTDVGTYFRPHPGGSILVGGTEPECDPLVWLADPDDCDGYPTAEVWEAQVTRLARRMPEVPIPLRPRGLAAVYDASPDWVPIYDRTRLDGYYVSIGTSGNQFKNAPLVGRFVAELVDACENGRDHDRDPVQVDCPLTGLTVDLGHYSRRRSGHATTGSVMG